MNGPNGLLAPAPLDFTVFGVDVPEAPLAHIPAPQSPPPGSDQSPAPPSAPPIKNATALSEPVAFRAGYSDYLRNAGIGQITAIAAPGAASILLFTIGGGFIGYRQARAGHLVRTEGLVRFLR